MRLLRQLHRRLPDRRADVPLRARAPRGGRVARGRADGDRDDLPVLRRRLHPRAPRAGQRDRQGDEPATTTTSRAATSASRAASASSTSRRATRRRRGLSPGRAPATSPLATSDDRPVVAASRESRPSGAIRADGARRPRRSRHGRPRSASRRSSSGRSGASPTSSHVVVAPLERARAARRGAPRGRARARSTTRSEAAGAACPPGAPRRLVDVDADPADHRAAGRLEQDPGDLPPADEHVVRPLDSLARARGRARSPPRPRARRRARAARAGAPAAGRSSSERRSDRPGDVAPTHRPLPAAAAGLVLGHGDGALRQHRRRAARPGSRRTPRSSGTAARSARAAAARRRRPSAVVCDPSRASVVVRRVAAAALHARPAALRRRAAARARRAVGCVGTRRRSTRSASASFATSRSTASSRLRAWLRSSCATARSTGAGPRDHARRFCASVSDVDASTSKTASTRVSALFACWPPGPDERETRSSISPGSMETERVTRIDSRRHGVHSPGRRRGAARLRRGDPRRARGGRAAPRRRATRSGS